MIGRFALIIGAMKCGTTTLYSYLTEHPPIAACRVKEPNFFAVGEEWKRGLGEYEALWEWDPATHRVALEASTAYSKVPVFPSAAARIATMPASFRFIYLVRDPVRRIESHLTHLATRGTAVGQPVDDRLLARLIDVSSYARQLDEYRHRFPLEDILVVRLGRLRSDPEGTVRRACRFLGLESHEPSRIGQAHSSQAVMAADQRLARWFGRHPGLRRLAAVLPRGVRRVLRRPLEWRLSDRVRLTRRQRRRVRRALRDDQMRLADEYAVDTSEWGGC